MPTIDSYLTFDGNCAEAMRFYQGVLGGKLDLMTVGESPMAAQTPPGSENRIMHARLTIGDRMLMASDGMVGVPYQGMHGFSLALVYPTVAEAQKVFDAFAKGGNVSVPLAKAFWVEAFGMVRDRFGTPWMINGGKWSMSPP